MKHRVAALCASVCVLCWLSPANADTTYTWDALSSELNGAPVAPLSLSFTVSGSLNFTASSSFAAPSNPTVEYPFPGNLVSLSLDAGQADLTLANFTNERGIAANAFPNWNLSLAADPNAGTATLALYFAEEGQYSYDITTGSPAYNNPYGDDAVFETGQTTKVAYNSDELPDAINFTGYLLASDPPTKTPEPSALALLLPALAGLGLIRSAKRSATPAG